jgi:hypothetical protein
MLPCSLFQQDFFITDGIVHKYNLGCKRMWRTSTEGETPCGRGKEEITNQRVEVVVY